MRNIELWKDNGQGVWGFFMEDGECVYAKDYAHHIESELFLEDVLAFLDDTVPIGVWWGNALKEFPTTYEEVTENGRRLL